MKRPIVIEFSGLPNSGKTTLLNNLKQLFECSEMNAIIMQEPAELIPNVIPKGSTEQNLWITLETLQKSMEISFLSEVDFILLDRGFYNQLFWAKMYEEKNPEYTKYTEELMIKFSRRYNVKPDYLYIIDVEVEESIKRRMSIDKQITFSKADFLTCYRKKFAEFYEQIQQRFYIDTTNRSKAEVAEIVFETITSITR